MLKSFFFLRKISSMAQVKWIMNLKNNFIKKIFPTVKFSISREWAMAIGAAKRNAKYSFTRGYVC